MTGTCHIAVSPSPSHGRKRHPEEKSHLKDTRWEVGNGLAEGQGWLSARTLTAHPVPGPTNTTASTFLTLLQSKDPSFPF